MNLLVLFVISAICWEGWGISFHKCTCCITNKVSLGLHPKMDKGSEGNGCPFQKAVRNLHSYLFDACEFFLSYYLYMILAMLIISVSLFFLSVFIPWHIIQVSNKNSAPRCPGSIWIIQVWMIIPFRLVSYIISWISVNRPAPSVLDLPFVMSLGLWETPISSHNRVVFSFILTFSVISMVCSSLNTLGYFCVISSISLSYCFCILIYNYVMYGINDLTHLVPYGTPGILVPLLCVVESIGLIIRPITLTVRLCANVMVGHIFLNSIFGVFHCLLIYSGCSYCPVFSALLCWVLLFPIILWITLSVLILELSVLLIQGSVFVTLLGIYTQHS